MPKFSLTLANESVRRVRIELILVKQGTTDFLRGIGFLAKSTSTNLLFA